MDIPNLSSNHVKTRLLNEVSIAVLAMTIRDFRQNAEHMQVLLESADQLTQTVRDKNLGRVVDTTV